MRGRMITHALRRAIAPVLVAVALAGGCSKDNAEPPAASSTTITTPGASIATSTSVPGGPTTAAGSPTTATTGGGAPTPTTSAATTATGPTVTVDPLDRGGQVDPEGNPVPSTTPETFAPTTVPTPPASSASYCGKIAEALTALGVAKLGDGGADLPIDDVKARYAALASSAPDTIRADMAAVSTKIAGLSKASELGVLDTDPAMVTPRQHIAAWVKPNCGFDPDNPTG